MFIVHVTNTCARVDQGFSRNPNRNFTRIAKMRDLRARARVRVTVAVSRDRNPACTRTIREHNIIIICNGIQCVRASSLTFWKTIATFVERTENHVFAFIVFNYKRKKNVLQYYTGIDDDRNYC